MWYGAFEDVLRELGIEDGGGHGEEDGDGESGRDGRGRSTSPSPCTSAAPRDRNRTSFSRTRGCCTWRSFLADGATSGRNYEGRGLVSFGMPMGTTTTTVKEG